MLHGHKPERAAWVRACNSVKFETGRNLPPVLKIVTRTAHALLLSMWPRVLFSVWFSNFDQTTSFYWSYMFLLKPPVLMRSCYYILTRWGWCELLSCFILYIWSKSFFEHHWGKYTFDWLFGWLVDWLSGWWNKMVGYFHYSYPGMRGQHLWH